MYFDKITEDILKNISAWVQSEFIKEPTIITKSKKDSNEKIDNFVNNLYENKEFSCDKIFGNTKKNNNMNNDIRIKEENPLDPIHKIFNFIIQFNKFNNQNSIDISIPFFSKEMLENIVFEKLEEQTNEFRFTYKIPKLTMPILGELQKTIKITFPVQYIFLNIYYEEENNIFHIVYDTKKPQKIEIQKIDKKLSE